MRKRFHSALAVFLLAVFSVYVIPKEFVHALYNHTDTIDVPISGKNISHIGEQHIHCPFLSYEAEAFTPAPVAACPFSGSHTFAFILPAAEQPGVFFTPLPSFRGPPSLV